MRSNKFKSSTVIPLALTAYLAVMAYIGRHIYLRGDYLYYFGTIAVTLVIIVVLHFSLKKKEKLRQQRDDSANYGKYNDNSNTDNKKADDNN
ncbi:MAG: hypothetical protein PUD41_02940 [bacterium]|nr:hypothetical protein [bacterium]